VFAADITASWSAENTSPKAIARHGAKMSWPLSTAAVPKFTVIIGGIVRGRQLRHVRTRYDSALPLDVA